jgi:hypothetical protein
MKKKKVTPLPEMTLRPAERRARQRRMTKMHAGTNPLTKRQVRRLPSRATPSKASARKEARRLRRYARQQGVTVRELLG